MLLMGVLGIPTVRVPKVILLDSAVRAFILDHVYSPELHGTNVLPR